MMEKLRLNKFCCCCTLKTGSLVIGTLGWLSTIYQAFGISFNQITRLSSDVNNLDDVIYSHKEQAFRYCIVAFSFFLSILLVIGIYRDDRKLMLPWLIIHFLELIGLYIGAFACFIAIFVSTEAAVFGILFVVILISSVICTYFYLCIWSHYQDLGETAVRPQLMTTEERQIFEDNNVEFMDGKNQNIV